MIPPVSNPFQANFSRIPAGTALIGEIYLQPTVTYIPNPGASPSLSPATAITLRATILF
jgi:carbohydrate-selective porin OprB